MGVGVGVGVSIGGIGGTGTRSTMEANTGFEVIGSTLQPVCLFE